MHKTIKFALSEAYEKGYEEGLKASATSDTNCGNLIVVPCPVDDPAREI